MMRNKCEKLCAWSSGHVEHLKKHMLCLKVEEAAISIKKKAFSVRGKKGTCLLIDNNSRTREKR